MRRKKRNWTPLILGLLLLGLLFIWQLPAILRAIPSRYLYRAPEFIQEIARGDQNPILPTVMPQGDAAALLAPTSLPSATASPTPAVIATGNAPATPTSIPTSTAPPVPTAIPIPINGNARLEGIFHQFQTWNNCGPATLAMTLSYFDLFIDQSETATILKPSTEDRNVSPTEMAAYVNNQTEIRALDRVNGSLDTLRRLLDAGFPVIIEIGLDPPGEYAWLEWYGHYLLVVAYDDAQGQIWVYDSWFGTSEVPMENKHSFGRIVTYENLENYWAQFNRSYITLYRPEQEATLQTILGSDWDTAQMWQNTLVRAQADAAANPDNAFFWFNLGTAYAHLGDYERSAAAFDEARAINLPWRMLWYQFGPYEAYYQVGRYEDVLTLTNATLETYDYFEEALYYRGLAEQALGDTTAAAEDFAKAAAFNPNFTPAVEALSKLN